MAQPMPLPEHIGRYEIVSEIGRGAMGRVFLAMDPVIDRQIALKVMAPQTEFDPKEWDEMQERFLLEARAAGRLRHPGVVTIFDADRDQETDTAYIAMEFVDGQSLQEMVHTCAPLRPAQILPIIEQVGLALNAAHDKGLVHRDVKPANILLDDQGAVKLTDFGITKFQTHNLTAAGTVLGSPSYMSPEQVRGEAIDDRAALFALGVVLFESLTGKLPFHGDSLATVTYNILELDPISSTDLESSVGPEVVDLVRRATEKDRSKRFQSGYEFAQSIRAVLTDTPSPQGPRGTQLLAAGSIGQARSSTQVLRPQPPQQGTGGSKTMAWLLAAVVVLAISVGIPAFRSQPPDPIDRRLDEAQRTDVPADAGIATPTTTEPTTQDTTTEIASGAEVAPAEATTFLAIRYKNRLKAGRISIWIDGERVWSRAISMSGGMFKRTSGELISDLVPVVPGRHTLEVRITGAERKVDVGKKIEGVFQEQTTRTLQIGLLPAVKKLKLSWKE